MNIKKIALLSALLSAHTFSWAQTTEVTPPLETTTDTENALPKEHSSQAGTLDYFKVAVGAAHISNMGPVGNIFSGNISYIAKLMEQAELRTEFSVTNSRDSYTTNLGFGAAWVPFDGAFSPVLGALIGVGSASSFFMRNRMGFTNKIFAGARFLKLGRLEFEMLYHYNVLYNVHNDLFHGYPSESGATIGVVIGL